MAFDTCFHKTLPQVYRRCPFMTFWPHNASRWRASASVNPVIAEVCKRISSSAGSLSNGMESPKHDNSTEGQKEADANGTGRINARGFEGC